MVCDSTRRLLARTGAEPGEVAGLSFSAHNPSCIPLDERGALIQDRIPIYADLRARDQAGWMLDALGGADRFYGITGCGQIPEHYQVFKILWLRENHPDLFERTAKIVNTVDYVTLRLTGRTVTDFSQASNIGFMDIRTGAWSRNRFWPPRAWTRTCCRLRSRPAGWWGS